MNGIEKKWYVVRAISGKENKIRDLVNVEIQRAGLEQYVEQILIPTEKVIQIVKNARNLDIEIEFEDKR